MTCGDARKLGEGHVAMWSSLDASDARQYSQHSCAVQAAATYWPRAQQVPCMMFVLRVELLLGVHACSSAVHGARGYAIGLCTRAHGGGHWDGMDTVHGTETSVRTWDL
mmetsp:Transcript_31097/g.69074  ORF Transcript_31097/g.69074 Transcript_31097/m.69074 type:complete len:109 (-) Transcript_31097:244-570(-)